MATTASHDCIMIATDAQCAARALQIPRADGVEVGLPVSPVSTEIVIPLRMHHRPLQGFAVGE